jgi:hypothetical protein
MAVNPKSNSKDLAVGVIKEINPKEAGQATEILSK